MEQLSYPIGRYEEQAYSDKQRDEWIRDIEFLPGDLEYAITNLDADQLNTPYRDGDGRYANSFIMWPTAI